MLFRSVQVVDGNAVDREVSRQQPNLVIVEAIWVTPDKLRELTAKYPQISWVVRLHSEVPFLANEGVALDWISRYVQIDGVRLAANSRRLARELSKLLSADIFYLPNYYEEL